MAEPVAGLGERVTWPECDAAAGMEDRMQTVTEESTYITNV